VVSGGGSLGSTSVGRFFCSHFGGEFRLQAFIFRFKLDAFTFEAFQIRFAGADRLAGERNKPPGSLAW
jgi:hypothetical protein